MTYNGWKNCETWAITLHLDNDGGTYTMARERAAEVLREAPEDSNVVSGIWTPLEAARYNLADWLKDFTETLCGLGSDFGEDWGIAEPSLLAQDLIRAAISEADFDEIANHYIES